MGSVGHLDIQGSVEKAGIPDFAELPDQPEQQEPVGIQGFLDTLAFVDCRGIRDSVPPAPEHLDTQVFVDCPDTRASADCQGIQGFREQGVADFQELLLRLQVQILLLPAQQP